MEDLLKEKMINILKVEGMDQSFMDDDLEMILEDLAMDSARLKRMLMEKGMDEIKTVDTMKKIADSMSENEALVEEDEEW